MLEKIESNGKREREARRWRRSEERKAGGKVSKACFFKGKEAEGEVR